MPIEELSLKVVGAAHLNKDGSNRRSEIIFCAPGDPIELRPEPKNPVDPQAVAVFSKNGIQIGYLTAERAPWIGAMLNQGRDIIAIFQEEAPFGAVVRANLNGRRPILPERAEPQDNDSDHDPDFYPDYEPPDEFL